MVTGAGFAINTIEAKGFRRRLSADVFKSFYWAGRGFFKMRRLVREFAPTVVVGCGGAVSAPVVLAASWAGVPVVVQEQNVIPGLTNRLVGRVATLIAASFEGSRRYFPRRKRVVVTGNPVRRTHLGLNRAAAAKKLGLDAGRRTVLVLGGTLGAQAINRAAVEAYDAWRDERTLQVIHITGEANLSDVSAALERLRRPSDDLLYQAIPYADEIGLFYAAADLVIARAGASTCSELAVWNKPAVLVPYPHATRAHQDANAQVVSDAGGAHVMRNEDLSGRILAQTTAALLADAKTLDRMRLGMKAVARPDAAAKLAGLVEEVSLEDESTD